MIRLRLERLQDRWAVIRSSPAAVLVGRLIGLSIRLIWRVAILLLWRARMIWARMSGRARLVVSIVVLVLVSRESSSFSSSISATAQGLAVLLLAGAGLWMIATSPRRRRW